MAKNILVIDDDILVLKTIKKLLDREGYIVETAKNAQEGLEKIMNQEFNLVVSDVRMPGKDGIELIEQAKEIRKKENKPPLPFVFVTGYASEETPIKALKLGAKDYAVSYTHLTLPTILRV